MARVVEISSLLFSFHFTALDLFKRTAQCVHIKYNKNTAILYIINLTARQFDYMLDKYYCEHYNAFSRHSNLTNVHT